MKNLLWFGALFFCACTVNILAPPVVEERPASQTVRDAMNATIRVSVQIKAEGAGQLTGSGWANTDSTFITAGHVCEAIIELQEKGVLEDKITISYLNRVDGLSSFSGAEIIEIDGVNDICLLYYEDHGLPTLPFANEYSIKFNDTVWVIGFPLGLMITSGEGSVIIVNTGEEIDPIMLKNKMIVSSASTSGNSGGPVINKYGEVVGMLVSGPANGYDHLSVCTTIAKIKAFLKL